MLKLINYLPPQVLGIHAYAQVTETEYENALIPLLDHQLKKSRKINLILILETDIKNFAAGLWCGSVKVGTKYFFRWNKIAIVTDQKGTYSFSDLFKYIIPGKFNHFSLSKMDQAMIWIAK